MPTPSLRTLSAIAVVAGLTAAASASPYTVAGYSWDTVNSFNAATLVGGPVTFSNATPFPALVGAERDLSLGRLLGNGTPGNNRRVNMGDQNNRATVELTFAGLNALPNGAGEDFVVYEQGDANQPEGFAVAVRLAGQSAFTPFRYDIFDAQQAATGASYFATGFDLSDFGLAPGAAIDAIRIVNLISTDKVATPTADGQGFGLVGPTGFIPDARGPGSTYTTGFPGGELDPDITYVGNLHTLVPAPAAPALFALAALRMGRRRR